jgi:hypothetical protein
MPRSARGISATMMRALNITAARIADRGVASRIRLRGASWGRARTNMAGTIAKYLATSFAMEKLVRAPRVMRSCLPISTISSSMWGSRPPPLAFTISEGISSGATPSRAVTASRRRRTLSR